MSLELFGKPLFIWFGALTFISLFCTAYIGLNMRKYGFKTHKIFAFATLVFAVLHLALGAWQGLF